MSRKEFLAFSSLILTTILLLWPRFGPLIKHPNAYVFAHDGDGLKNYFLFSYYLQYDHGLQFTGLNYPYGDNLLFTDSHPFLALFLNWVDDHVISIAEYAVGWINVSLLLGILVGVGLIYLILRHYNTPRLYSGIMALCIVFLSPQLDRLHGHLSLSYTFAIPLFWWLILQAEKRGKRWYFLLVLAGFIMGGLHLYYVAIFSIFLLAYAVVSFFSGDRRISSFMESNWLLLASGIAPLLLFLLISTLTDPFDDRPVNPYGFYVYHATPASVFLPHFSALTQVIRELFSPKMNWEGRAFIGNIPLIYSWILLVSVLLRLLKGRPLPQKLFADKKSLVAAMLVLLFSMCIPFTWGLEFLTDWIPPLRQFRALGRFSWVFYYVIALSAAVALYRFYQVVRNQYSYIAAIIVMSLGTVIWTLDATSYFQAHTRDSIHPNELTTGRDFPIDSQKIDDFQAIMAVPLVSIRTDKMVFNRSLLAYNEAMKIANVSGIPIIQSSTSRPSLSQSLSNIQMISDTLIPKTRLKDMNDKPLLLIAHTKTALHPGEQRLVERGTMVGQSNEFAYYRLPVSAFRAGELPDQYPPIPLKRSADVDIYAPDSLDFYYDGFADGAGNAIFRGSGSKFGSRGPLEIFKSEIDFNNSPWEASFWVYVDPSYHGMPVVTYRFGDGPDQNEMKKIALYNQPDIWDGWIRVAFTLQNTTWHSIELDGHDMTVDELLVRPVSVNIKTTYKGGQVSINNFPLINER